VLDALALAAGAWGLSGGVWWARGRDLALMREGRRDPAGRAQTVGARLGAAAVLVVPLVGALADVPRSWLRRWKKGLWHCPGDVPPERIRRVHTFQELVRAAA